MSNLSILKTGIFALNLKIDLFNFYGKLFGIREIKEALDEPEAWIQEDEDYARHCAEEKWRSNH